MSFLLDTNVVSEWVKARPNPGVVSWLAAADEDRVFASVVTWPNFGMESNAWQPVVDESGWTNG